MTTVFWQAHSAKKFPTHRSSSEHLHSTVDHYWHPQVSRASLTLEKGNHHRQSDGAVKKATQLLCPGLFWYSKHLTAPPACFVRWNFAPLAPSCIAQITGATGHFTTALECYSIHNCNITAFLLEPLHISSLAAFTNGNHLNPICPANNLQRTFSLFQMHVHACLCLYWVGGGDVWWQICVC